jgi:copper resistance protein B
MQSSSVLSAIALILLAAPQSHAQHTADSHYDGQAMQAAREQLRREHGGQTMFFLQAERFEYQTNGPSGTALWDAQGWVGGDYNRFWVKTEGEYSGASNNLQKAEIQALYSRPISPYFDFQAGVRQDMQPGARRTFGVIGIQGLAPYWFEIDTALFISHHGDVSARLEAEYDLRFTQRLILQPRAELNVAFQDVPELAIGSGLSMAEIGARLRYEFKREFAPYIGVSWGSATGRTADLLRRDGRDPGGLSFVAGLRLWF